MTFLTRIFRNRAVCFAAGLLFVSVTGELYAAFPARSGLSLPASPDAPGRALPSLRDNFPATGIIDLRQLQAVEAPVPASVPSEVMPWPPAAVVPLAPPV